jgi:nitroreductase
MIFIEAIQIRKSCRTYSGENIEPGKLDELKRFLESNNKTVFGSKLRFHLLDFSEPEIGDLRRLSTYGVIQGARQFIVGAVKKQPLAMEDYGYCMEKNILMATSLGLGTCILGGTFKRSGFAEKIGMGEDETLPVISPVGYARQRKSIVDSIFHLVAGSDRRKPWNEIFYLDNGNPLFPDDQNLGEYKTPLECVRLAPSAMNKQPWRVVIGKGEMSVFHFYLKRTPGYEKSIKDVKLQNVDMGLALCHFEVSAKELGLKGSWEVQNPQIKTENWEYVATWVDHGC